MVYSLDGIKNAAPAKRNKPIISRIMHKKSVNQSINQSTEWQLMNPTITQSISHSINLPTNQIQASSSNQSIKQPWQAWLKLKHNVANLPASLPGTGTRCAPAHNTEDIDSAPRKSLHFRSLFCECTLWTSASRLDTAKMDQEGFWMHRAPLLHSSTTFTPTTIFLQRSQKSTVWKLSERRY